MTCKSLQVCGAGSRPHPRRRCAEMFTPEEVLWLLIQAVTQGRGLMRSALCLRHLPSHVWHDPSRDITARLPLSPHRAGQGRRATWKHCGQANRKEFPRFPGQPRPADPTQRCGAAGTRLASPGTRLVSPGTRLASRPPGGGGPGLGLATAPAAAPLVFLVLFPLLCLPSPFLGSTSGNDVADSPRVPRARRRLPPSR